MTTTYGMEVNDDKRIASLTAAFSVDTSAYTSGDLVGPKLVIPVPVIWGPQSQNVGLILDSVVISDAHKSDANLDVILFRVDPSGSTFTDNAACDIVAADIPNIVAAVSVTTWFAFSATGVGQATGLRIPIVIPGGVAPVLYACLVARATPTYHATDLALRLNVRRGLG